MKKYLVEFIGTFFLVLTIIMTVLGGAGSMAPVAIGSVLMVMIFAGGHLSGAHYNPAVTLAVWMRGKCETSEILPYMGSQFAGSVLAALVGAFLLGANGAADAVTSDLSQKIGAVILAEFLGTFALCYVVLNVATARGTSGNSFYGLAIGFTVLACAYALGPISGGCFNPAVALGVSVAEMCSWSDIIWILVGNFGGAAAAAYTFLFVNGKD